MNITILKKMKMRNFLRSINKTKAIAQLTMGLMTMMISVISFAQPASCDEAYIACNDGVQISLNEDCLVVVGYDMIVEDPYPGTYDDDDDVGTPEVPSYAVELLDEDENPLLDSNGDPLTELDASFEGQTIKVKVTYLPCDISCWGRATIEDKFPPQIVTCADITVSCDVEVDTLSLKNNPLYSAFYRPEVNENCGGELYEHVDFPSAVLCEDGFAQIYTRVWEISDMFGNTAGCVQKIFIERGDVDDIMFPDDYIVDVDVDTPCSAFNKDNLTPDVTGEPSHFTCPNLDFFYTDTEFDMCGASVKCLRTWFAIDWCTGETREEGQNIEVIDDVAPVVSCPVDYLGVLPLAVEMDGGTCTSDIVLDPFGNLSPNNGTEFNFLFECSEYIFRIEYKFADDEGLPDPDEDFTSDGVIENADGTYTIQDVPAPRIWIRYFIEDVCGNSVQQVTDGDASCAFEIDLDFDEDPQAICEAFTDIELGADQTATMTGEIQLDDNSFDPCGSIASYMIKRVDDHCDGFATDLEYGDFITFCCEDLGKTDIAVMLKVTDDDGNIDECTGYVNVNGNVPVTVTCPPNTPVNLDCGEDPEDQNYPAVSVSSDCDVTTTQSVNFSGTLDCGVGTITRTVTVRDAGGSTIETCQTTINIENNDPFSQADIDCPDDVVVDGCGSSTDPDLIGGKPTLSNNSSCSDLILSHEDYPAEDGYVSPHCYSFKRVWTVIDWCRYDVDNPDEGVFYCEQYIHVNSASGPVFTSDCDDLNVDAGFDCEEEVSLIAVAIDSDGCTPSSDIEYSWMIDANSNGTYEFSGSGNDASGTYPVGTHKVKFTATDACGNSEMCMYTFTITGSNGPTPICRAHLIIGIDNDGTAEIWASDFDIKSEAGCGADEDLTFSFTSDGNTPALEYDCEDIVNGIGQVFELQMYVIDADGQFEFCEVTLEIQDNKDVCPDADDNARIQGKIYNEDYDGLGSFDVNLHESQNAFSDSEITNDEGDYSFESVAFYDAYEVDPVNDQHPLNGVTTLDIVIIQQHILGLADLNSPYKIIAADVNNSDDVTAMDLLEIRKMILGLITEFPNNESWSFVNANHVFLDPANPWDYPRTFTIPNMYVDITNAEFVGVKTGDVNGSVMESFGEEADTRNREAFTLMAQNRSFKAGDRVEVAIMASEAIQSLGLQVAFDVNSSIQDLTITNGLISLHDSNIATSANEIRLSVDQVNGVNANEGEVLFTLAFTAMTEGTVEDVLEINDNLAAEIYTKDLESMDLNITFADDQAGVVKAFEIYQNEPNPFANTSTLPFYTPEASSVQLSIYDADGRLVYSDNQQFAKGFNSFTVNAADIDKYGVLIYRLESENFSGMKKMIITK